MIAVQLHQGRGLGQSVVGPESPVAVSHRRGAVLTVSSEQTLVVAFAGSHHLGGLDAGKMVFQYGVEHFYCCLFLPVQLYIPHRDETFADLLAGDLFEEQPQEHQNLLHLDEIEVTSPWDKPI